MKILIVDDEPNIVSCLSEILEDYHETISTSSSEQAMSLLSSNDIDFVITDYNMPNINGMDLAKFAINQYGTKVLIMTGDTELTTENPSIKIIFKPIKFSKLLNIIETFSKE